jgi:hypothetical protein
MPRSKVSRAAPSWMITPHHCRHHPRPAERWRPPAFFIDACSQDLLNIYSVYAFTHCHYCRPPCSACPHCANANGGHTGTHRGSRARCSHHGMARARCGAHSWGGGQWTIQPHLAHAPAPYRCGPLRRHHRPHGLAPSPRAARLEPSAVDAGSLRQPSVGLGCGSVGLKRCDAAGHSARPTTAPPRWFAADSRHRERPEHRHRPDRATGSTACRSHPPALHGQSAGPGRAWRSRPACFFHWMSQSPISHPHETAHPIHSRLRW